ncbi:LCP family protein [Solicola sp. PLA-1-18]|uniref:LCP family protein n=1 Tax=Solicola sp. PLA-1-18 TaxID=3380532 RepID=UPI003B7A9539
MSHPRTPLFGPEPAEDVSARVRFRRALVLMAMTLVMPGSAQLVLGNKRVGRIAIRCWLAAWTVLLVLVLLAMTSRSSLLSVFTSGSLLWVGRMLLIGAALGWVVLFVDAWRLGAPLELRRPHRLAMTGVNSVLCFVTAGSLFFGAHVMAVQKSFMDDVFGQQTVSIAEQGRYNVLLLGADSGKGRVGLRPDSLMVASIDADTGRTVLVGLPRNLANVPFPKGSTMREQFPKGFDCDGCYLNGVNTWAEDHKELFPGVTHPGIAATKQAVSQATGLDIGYYAMVNLHGFKDLVDAVGGVRLTVPERVPIGGIGAPITGYVKKGTYKLDGKETLWFARSRVANNDYSRMARQKCVMSAMLQQLSPQTVLMNVNSLANSSKRMLETDIPQSELDTFIDLALKARSAKVSTVSVVPPAINTSNPDFDEVRAMVSRAVDVSEGKTVPKPKKQVAAEKAAKAKTAGQAPDVDKERSTTVNETQDLASAC